MSEKHPLGYKLMVFGGILGLLSLLFLLGNRLVSVSNEGVAASASAARSVDTATVSGTIRHDGSPLAGVAVEVNWEAGGEATTTAGDGTYSVSGVPVSGWVQIFVRPPITQRLGYRNWGAESIGGDLVKDFDLVAGHRLQGSFQTPDGAPFSQTFWLGASALGFSPPEGEWFGDTAFDGQFDMVLPSGVYVLDRNSVKRPYFMPVTKVDLRTADQTGQSITLLDAMPPPFPTTPPDVAGISVGVADGEGLATVTGAPGTVLPLSGVALINLNSSSVITAIADADGAFTAEVFAPSGSALLVKYDPIGDRVAQLWGDAHLVSPPDLSYMNPLPGAILPVGTLLPGSGSEQPFHAAGRFGGDQEWGGWWLTGTVTGPPGSSDLHVQSGDSVTVNGLIHMTSPSLECTDPGLYQPITHLTLRYLFDEAGYSYPWGNWFNAHIFTPTGLPIEHEADGESRGVGSAFFTGLACAGPHTLVGEFDLNMDIPSDLGDGVYRIEAWIDPGGVPADEAVPHTVVWYHSGPVAFLPSLTVGSPAPPRIPWTLFGDYPVNGHRGVQAQEDSGHFDMPTRVVFPPHTVVLPRLDERTGAPIVYRLEPGSHWLSATDRRMPNPPHIPMIYPAGELSAEIHKPDGSVDTIGPVAVRQTSVRTPTTPGGAPLDHGTGHIGDLYHLYTGDDAFAYSFDQYGLHTIILDGEVQDIYGNVYSVQGSYPVTVARVLDLDPAQLPTTPYEQGDAFAPGLHLFPPVPADVTVQLVHMPYSDPTQSITHTITGQANRFGYFQPPAGTEIRLDAPGEFRVDISAKYKASDGTGWAGSMTWGNVVEGPNAQIEAHGRRGMDYHDNTIDDMPAWFKVFDMPPEKVGIEVYYPYFSGDIHWGNEDRAPGDSIHSIITVKDKAGINGPIYNLMRTNFSHNRNGYRWPPDEVSLAGLEKRLAIGEAPLFITTASGIDPEVDPNDIDQLAYWYGSSERPDVHVREIISEDNMGTAYWRFDDTYGYQIGEPADGDKPGDLKWEFGGAVFRVPDQGINEYAIYSSLWVLLPHGCDEFGCARISPPFQDATGASINGGPIMTLLGEDIDMLFLPKGVRPGDILEVGDTVAFSGHVGPPLNSRVEVTITAPNGSTHTRTFRANKIGWVYEPDFDFAADLVGRWTVDVFVEHDQPYVGNGVTPKSHNTGTVLGTSGQYTFYVVDPESPDLVIQSPQPGFMTWATGEVKPIPIRGQAPSGTTTVFYTIHDKGVVMGQGSLTPDANGLFTFVYDAKTLREDYPMLSLTAHEGQWEGLADEVAIHFLAVGAEPRAAAITLIGEEVFVRGEEAALVYLPSVIR